MNYEIEFTRGAVKQLKKLPTDIKDLDYDKYYTKSTTKTV
jgi:mRNA-degrading endonuclease RelE of RelBE toxin-antitoxin system